MRLPSAGGASGGAIAWGAGGVSLGPKQFGVRGTGWGSIGKSVRVPLAWCTRCTRACAFGCIHEP